MELAYFKHYSKLIGKQIKRVVHDDADQVAFGLEFTDGTIAWIMCDPEGNGPGFLDIESA